MAYVYTFLTGFAAGWVVFERPEWVRSWIMSFKTWWRNR